VTTVLFEIKQEFTTMDVYKLIKDGGYWRYKYDGNGSGCLYWTRTLIEVLEAKGWIETGSVVKLDEAIAATREKEGIWVPDDQGSFF
jgi:hypothetical protein